MTSPEMAVDSASLARKPRDDEIDVFGVTHAGRVRPDNQDHFLVCDLRKRMVVRNTSLPDTDRLLGDNERLAFLAMVADGVGGGAKGAEASQVALEAVTQYVTHSMRCYYAIESAGDDDFHNALQDGARQTHEELLRRGEADASSRGMATTLTLYLGVWPRAYLLQVGDSRCYLLRNGELMQITRDQTMAQELVDAGVMPAAQAAETRLAHTLSSSIGGRQTDPKVTAVTMDWGHVVLLCSDGLTRQVPDARIREVLSTMISAEQACGVLLNEALESGGLDNITIVVGRALQREPETPASP